MAEYSILPIRPVTARDIPGIYAIRHIASGKLYVGSAAKIAIRWRSHRYQLRLKKHHSPRLQNSWNKYGERAFEFVVLEIVQDADARFTREQHWIDLVGAATSDFGLNIHPQAGGPRGHKLSPEIRAKMSATRIGRKMSPRRPEHSAAISAAKIGKGGWKMPPRTDSHRTAISAAKKGKKTGKRPPRSAAHCAAISASRRGKPWAPEHAAKSRTLLVERNKRIAAENRRVPGQLDLFG